MNKSVLIIVGGALAIAAIVGLVVSSKLSPKQATVQKASTAILVANKLLFIGQKLKAEDVRWQDWPDDAVFKGIVKKADQPDLTKLSVYNAPLRRNIESGEPVTTQALVPDAKGAFLSALISPGMRAVSIGVGTNSGAGGFVSPGDHVDVILSYTAKLVGPAQDYAPQIVQKYASQLLLSNVKVLAVDQDAKDDAHEAKVAKTVTLEVSAEDSEKLAMAEQMGSLSLTLRRLGEKDDPNAPVPPLVTDVNTSDVIKQVNKLMDDSKTSQPNTEIRMYNGNNVYNIPVRPAPVVR
ncbi:MAG: Flp pilus assembly protein CpaB [Proteobacteria bacterium]|nr:Flp pilus assembly protein CpaB [Pseudomonadota bacterium]